MEQELLQQFMIEIFIMVGLIIGLLVNYLITLYPLLYFYKAAGLKNPNHVFIPIFGQFKVYNLANLSAWFCLIQLAVVIPIIGSICIWIFMAYVNFKISKNFRLGTLGCILSIFIGIFVWYYIAIKKLPFQAELKSKYLDLEV